MKNFTSLGATGFMLVLCVCLTISGSLQAEIVFQHNFENLDNPPTDAQLSSPNIIHPDLTNNFPNSGLLYQTRIDGAQKALSIIASGNTAVYVLELQLPICKRLIINNISFKGFASSDASFSIKADGVAYGGAVSSTGNSYRTVKLTEKRNIPGSSLGIRIEIMVYSTTPGTVSSIDDLTIDGAITNSVSKLETIIFPNTNNPPLDRCQGPAVISYIANLNTYYKSLTYELDDASKAAGITMTNNAVVTFPSAFIGKSSITATAIGCENQSLIKTIEIRTTAVELPYTDMDLKTTRPSVDLANGCFTTGLAKDGNRSFTAKVRFINNIRNIEITRSNGGYTRPEVQLYFSQSDFDNYRGGLKLPKNPSDEEGIANLRLRLVSDHFFSGGGEVDITPELRWDDLRKYWIITLRFLGADGEINVGTPPNAPWAFPTFKAFLVDRQTPLPVKLESITAKSTPEGNRITWKTTEEINFSHFEVEKSEDPRLGFHYLAPVSSAKNLSGSNYHYTDVPSSALQQYYRLKMVDFDGSFEYSKIVTAGGQSIEELLLVYPNPIENHIFLQSPDAVKSVRLVDQKGNEVFSKSFLDEGKLLSIPLPKLNAGAYYLKVNSGADNQQVRKVLIR